MAIYKDNYRDLVDVIVEYWNSYYWGDFGAHSSVFMDDDTGEMWTEMYAASSTFGRLQPGVVFVCDIARPDDFCDEGFPYLEEVREEIDYAIFQGLSNL